MDLAVVEGDGLTSLDIVDDGSPESEFQSHILCSARVRDSRTIDKKKLKVIRQVNSASVSNVVGRL